MPFTDTSNAHHESQAARGSSALIRMGHDARIAQRRCLDGVFAGECGSQQQHSSIRMLDVHVQTVDQFIGVPAECIDQVPVPCVETYDDIVQRQTHLFLAEGKNAPQHGSRPGVVALEPFLPWDEKLCDDPRRVRG
jgi:hypothetical protein